MLGLLGVGAIIWLTIASKAPWQTDLQTALLIVILVVLVQKDSA